jgi:hypothetical protein
MVPRGVEGGVNNFGGNLFCALGISRGIFSIVFVWILQMVLYNIIRNTEEVQCILAELYFIKVEN